MENFVKKNQRFKMWKYNLCVIADHGLPANRAPVDAGKKMGQGIARNNSHINNGENFLMTSIFVKILSSLSASTTQPVDQTPRKSVDQLHTHLF
jgi:hypothetical protein